MTAPTPAVKRAATAFPYLGAEDDARRALTAALNDPDDPDSLARTLFSIDAALRLGIAVDDAGVMWKMAPDARRHWRQVADVFSVTLTGGGA